MVIVERTGKLVYNLSVAAIEHLIKGGHYDKDCNCRR